MKTITVAVVGAGFAGDFHCKAFKKLGNVRFKIVMDVNIDRANALKEKWGFEIACDDYESVLQDPEIDLVDIATPPAVHADFSIRALDVGKHVISEKPLTGYFGQPEDEHPIGLKVSKKKMYEATLKELDAVKNAVNNSKAKFMYAENYIYSPAIVKAAEILRAKKNRVLYSIGECRVHGSPSELSKLWKHVGGGSLLRLGAHPLSGVLYLKQIEAMAHGENIKAISVTADVGRTCVNLSEDERKHLLSNPVDVEDFANIVVTFSDGSKSIIFASDHTMGGIRNVIKMYCNDGVIECKMTIADNMKTYFANEEGLDGVYISENLRMKAGWNNVLVAEETLRGYLAQLAEFVECAIENREPQSGFALAYDTTKIIYAAYLSAEEGRRIDLN